MSALDQPGCAWPDYPCPERSTHGGLCAWHAGLSRRRADAAAPGIEPAAPAPTDAARSEPRGIFSRLNKREASRPARRGRCPLLTADERLWTYFVPEPNTGCWFADRSDPRGSVVVGYGRVASLHGHSRRGRPRQLRAASAAWFLSRGEEPPGPLHRQCDTEDCVNPAHQDIEPRVVREEPATPRPERAQHWSAKPVTWAVPTPAEQQALVRQWMPLARRLAARMTARNGDLGIERAELDQAAYLGLVIAVSRFDPTRGRAFSTYAKFWIRAELTKAAKRVLNPTSGSERVLPWRAGTITVDELEGRYEEDAA